MSWLSSFVSHNSSWLAPVTAAIPFVGPTIAHNIDATNAAGQTAAASQAAAAAAAAQATANQAALQAAGAYQLAPAGAQSAISNTSPSTQKLLMYGGVGLVLLLVLYLVMQRRH